MSESKVKIDKAKVEYLKKQIILLENQYLKQGKRNDQSMVGKIMHLIEETTKCYLKR